MKHAFRKAVEAIERRGILLVYPLQNRPEPKSLWSELHPRTRMRWEWDADGDDRVAELWSLREALSRSHEAVYAKWYQGRATFFSRAVFTDLLAWFQTARHRLPRSTDSARVLEILESDSPLSTKIIKELSGLQGRLQEPLFNRTMKPLWRRLHVVGFGEVADSSFPSLAVGATRLIHEGLWEEAQGRSPEAAAQALTERLGDTNLFLRFAQKCARD